MKMSRLLAGRGGARVCMRACGWAGQAERTVTVHELLLAPPRRASGASPPAHPVLRHRAPG